jgi:hypothetical protein
VALSSTVAPITGGSGKKGSSRTTSRSKRDDPTSAWSALLAPPLSTRIAQQLDQVVEEAAIEQAPEPVVAKAVRKALVADNSGYVEEYVRAYMEQYEQQRQAKLAEAQKLLEQQEQQRLQDEEAHAVMALVLML